MLTGMDEVSAGATLAELVRRRIDDAYGGSQRKFARALGFTPQSVYSLVHGKVALPQAHNRRVLARELGLSHVRLLVLAGELDEGEVPEGALAAPLVGSDDPRYAICQQLRDVSDGDLPAVALVVEKLAGRPR